MEFSHTRSYVTGRQQRRHIAGKLSVTETLRINGSHGVYRWNGRAWELYGVYASASAAIKAQARARREISLLQSN
jgi:hypothetical protein